MVPGGQSVDQVGPDECLNGTDSQADSPRLQFQDRPATARADRPDTLVQLELIWTATPRAANAVGTRDHRYRSSNASSNATGRRWISV